MRKVLFVFVLGAISLILASCGNNPRAFLRIVHTAPGISTTPSLDITIDGNKVLSSVAYSTGSNYFTVTPGSRHFQVNLTGDKTFLIDTMIDLASKTYTTKALVNFATPSTISIASTTDDHSPPAAGQVKIRVLHAAVGYTVPPTTNSAPVGVYITTFGTVLNGTAPTLQGVNFQTTTAYVTMPVGDLEVRVVPMHCPGDPQNAQYCANPDGNILIDSGKVTFTDKKQLQTYVLADQAPPSAQFQGFFLHDLN